MPCPSCTSSDAYSEWDDGHGYCFSCETYTPPKGVEYTLEYLPWRGISPDTFRRYEVKTRVSSDGEPLALAFPYPNGSVKVRSIAEKKFWVEGDISKAGLFGANLFDPGECKDLIITEGELDALSCWQALQIPAVSIQSASSGGRDVAALRSFVGSFERVHLCFDGDEAGRNATSSVARLFEREKLYHVRLSRHKDANAYIMAGEETELRSAFRASKKYLPENISSSLSDFKDILSEAPKWGVPYPFSTLTEMTYGIRQGEIVLITAQEGVGKTSLMHAIEHKLLKETTSNVGAIYLEEPRKRHLEALVGIELGAPVHLPDAGYTADQKLAALESILASDDRLYLVNQHGSLDPDLLLDTIRFLVAGCSCGYICLDHFNMVVGGNTGDDERKVLDYLGTKLAMMVVELGFAFIGVAHVNDYGQTRGSRYLGKVADVRIDLMRDVQAGDVDTTLIVSKNRYAAKTGYAGIIKFDPVTYMLKEGYNAT